MLLSYHRLLSVCTRRCEKISGWYQCLVPVRSAGKEVRGGFQQLSLAQELGHTAPPFDVSAGHNKQNIPVPDLHQISDVIARCPNTPKVDLEIRGSHDSN
jgi:hypothetical protein